MTCLGARRVRPVVKIANDLGLRGSQRAKGSKAEEAVDKKTTRRQQPGPKKVVTCLDLVDELVTEKAGEVHNSQEPLGEVEAIGAPEVRRINMQRDRLACR